MVKWLNQDSLLPEDISLLIDFLNYIKANKKVVLLPANLKKWKILLSKKWKIPEN